MKKLFIILSALVTAFFLFPPSAKAVCPICTVAVGAGLGLSRYLGIDDAVSSIWIGGLVLSMSFWLIDWLNKKNYVSGIKYYVYIVIAGMYLITLVPLKISGIIGHPFNTILGVDKILFGTVIGSGAFLLSKWTDKKVRKVRGKQLFVYQKVVFPLVSLIIASLVIYYFGGYLYKI